MVLRSSVLTSYLEVVASQVPGMGDRVMFKSVSVFAQLNPKVLRRFVTLFGE